MKKKVRDEGIKLYMHLKRAIQREQGICSDKFNIRSIPIRVFTSTKKYLKKYEEEKKLSAKMLSKVPFFPFKMFVYLLSKNSSSIYKLTSRMTREGLMVIISDGSLSW